MRIFKIRLIRIVLFFAIFFILNGIVTFLLEEKAARQTEMFKSYRSEEDIDLCIIGSSVVYCGFNPYMLDALLNRRSFDLATPSQPIKEARRLLEMAIATKKIKSAYIVCTPDTFSTKSSREIMKMERIISKENHLPAYRQICATALFITKEKLFDTANSVFFLFPWTYHNIPISPSNIIKNIRRKITGKFESEKLKYVGKGHWISDKQTDYNNITDFTKTFTTDASLDYSSIELDKICTLCKENNIDFFVFAPPYTVYDVLAWKDEYVEKMMQLKSFFAERNVEYYDFNFIKPEIFKSEEQYFIDFQHMNSAGADAFTSAFAKFLQMRAAGEDMEQYFYTPEEYFASIDYISAVNLSVVQKEDTLNFDAEAYCGSLVVPEYQFLIKEAGETAFSVIKDYGKESNLSFAPLKSGSYDVRVNARIEGTDTEFDRYNKKTIVFREKRGKR